MQYEYLLYNPHNRPAVSHVSTAFILNKEIPTCFKVIERLLSTHPVSELNSLTAAASICIDVFPSQKSTYPRMLGEVYNRGKSSTAYFHAMEGNRACIT